MLEKGGSRPQWRTSYGADETSVPGVPGAVTLFVLQTLVMIAEDAREQRRSLFLRAVLPSRQVVDERAQRAGETAKH